MNILLSILFWGAAYALIHTYLLFPLGLRIGSRKKRVDIPAPPSEQMMISVLIPAYNEEKVIQQKIDNIFQSDYPSTAMEVLVMSDKSTDKTDQIVRKATEKYPLLKFFRSGKRSGKPEILNKLVEKASGSVLIFTDANVFLRPDTIGKLVRHFSDPEIGLVDSRLAPSGDPSTGINYQEIKYTTREFRIKYREGLHWQIIMGPSGACYALRKSLFSPVPPTFLVDDFFIAMKTLAQGKKAITDPEAVVHEDAIEKFSEAFRRKVRIAAGNFQNLFYFRKMFCNIFSSVGWVFWSHKGLRWFGPIFLLIAMVSNLFLFPSSLLYHITLLIQGLVLSLIIPDLILVKFNKHIVILRFITHFYLMNLALLTGLIKYLNGIKTNVWEPTQRNTII